MSIWASSPKLKKKNRLSGVEFRLGSYRGFRTISKPNQTCWPQKWWRPKVDRRLGAWWAQETSTPETPTENGGHISTAEARSVALCKDTWVLNARRSKRLTILRSPLLTTFGTRTSENRYRIPIPSTGVRTWLGRKSTFFQSKSQAQNDSWGSGSVSTRF